MGICGLGGMFWEPPPDPNPPPPDPDPPPRRRDVRHYEQPHFGDLTRHDVFLNHRGPDVKKTFVSHLDDALRRVGQDPFLDAKSLVKGQHALHSIDEALSGVLVHVAVFSPRYAESKYCLNELCDMLHSQKPIIPVFYDVEPENLRWTDQGPFAKAFQRHMIKGRNQDVERWKAALVEVAAITGFRRIDHDNDTLLVNKVVKAVLNILPTTPPKPSARHPVGLEDSSIEVIKMLHDMGDKVGIMGICGMGGIGKTTLAREIYNREQSNFGSRCFLNDVKEVKGVAIMDLQAKMVMDLLQVDAKKMHSNFSHWFEKIQKKKVFIVVDDINEKKQVVELIPNLTGLAPGSRVLITSRDSNILNNVMLDVPQRKLYHVSKLNHTYSKDLFLWCAFRKNHINDVDVSFHSFVTDIVRACDGLPLALEVIGGSLAYKRNMPNDIKYWQDAISALRRNGEIISKLQFSYDNLAHHEDKRMFIDIACFMLGHPKEVAMEIWESSQNYSSATWSLSRLIDKNMVKIDYSKNLIIHDLLRDMGRNVVIERAQQKHEIQSHIWDPSFATTVLQKKKILNEVLALTVVGASPSKTSNAELYAYMPELKYLFLDNCPVDGSFSSWSQELKWLQWRNMPHQTLPSTLILPRSLAVLDLTNSNSLMHIWAEDIERNTAPCPELRILKLQNCLNLKDLSQHINNMVKLKILNVEGCRSLTSLPETIGGLTDLEYLNLSGCTRLTYLPNFNCLRSLKQLHMKHCTTFPKSFTLSSLEKLDLSFCASLQELPQSVCELAKLRELRMGGTALEELPENFGQLQNLRRLYMACCRRLRKLPESFSNLSNLETLNLRRCKMLQELPRDICRLEKLKVLWLYGTTLEELPENFGQLQRLTQVDLSNCGRLRKLPESFFNLSNLETLDLSNCISFQELPPSTCKLEKLKVLRLDGTTLEELPENFGLLHRLTSVSLSNCARLRKLPQSFCNLSNLETLYLTNCTSLQELPPSICELEKLKVFPLSGTALEELPENFGHLQRLTKVDLSNCGRLSKLPESFSNLSNLETLYLTNCTSFQELPPSICELEKLKVLRLGGTALEELPENFGHLQRLTEVDLSNCGRLSKLPESFSNLSSLEKLDLLECSVLQKLPASIGGLKKLGVLRITSTLLDELPVDLCKLQSLEKADMSWCTSLRTLPDSFFQLGHLVELNMFECELFEGLPPSFCKLKNLKFLRVTRAGLKELPEDFGQLQSLKEVNLSHCLRLTELPDSFSNLSKLEDVNLFGCKLLQKFPTSVCQLTNMRVLQMRGTALEELPEDFGQLKSLTYADLSQCASLTTLPDSFSELSNLEYLNLSGCSLLRQLPPFIGRVRRLRVLRMGRTALEELPGDFGQLECLTDADFQCCKQLQSLGESFGCLEKLRKLSLRGCSSLIQLPESFLKLSDLSSLDVRSCPLLQMGALPMNQLRLRLT